MHLLHFFLIRFCMNLGIVTPFALPSLCLRNCRAFFLAAPGQIGASVSAAGFGIRHISVM